jgi:hypothetical protein
MTPRARAEAAIEQWHEAVAANEPTDIVEFVERAINDAVADERERCANIAQEEAHAAINACALLDPEDCHDAILRLEAEAERARKIEARIRALSPRGGG